MYDQYLMIGTVPRDEKGEPIPQPSLYKPSEDVKLLTVQVREDYSTGFEILNRAYPEFNDLSLIQRQSQSQKAFGIYQEPAFVNPEEKWRWTGVRPLTRNKLISIAAHMLATLLYPSPKAQNEDDEEDKDMAEVMRLLIEHNLRKQNYAYTILYATVQALSTPALIAHVEYVEAMQTLRTKLENGDVEETEAVDELVSGVMTHIVPCEELLIANVREHELQRQRFLIRRRLLDFASAEARYGKHDNFTYIRPGIRVFYSDDPAGFYENKDDSNPTIVEEVIYYNRTEDIEVPFVNGFYMGEPNVKANLMTHRRLVRQQGKVLSMPVYPYAKTGYEPIGPNFFYYKDAAAKLSSDQTLTDKIWRMVVDGTFLSIIKPVINSGKGKITENVIYPGRVTNMTDAKIDFVDTKSNLSDGMALLQNLEQGASESTMDAQQSGISPEQKGTAFEFSALQQNAKIQLGFFGRMFARFIEDFGMLQIDCIIAHQTTGELTELMDKDQVMKYRTFLVPNQTEGGQSVSKKVELTEEYMGRALTEEQLLEESFNLMDKSGGYESTLRVYKVNPHKFAETQFSIVIEPDAFPAKGEILEKAMKLEAYDRMIANPLLDQQAVARDFLIEAYAKGQADKYMAKTPPPMTAPGADPSVAGPSTVSPMKAGGATGALSGLLTGARGNMQRSIGSN